ncbi:glycosyltransferase [Streptomyces sp. NPDC051976]|uniref:glycosyltransferase n=1 Tax=Streptomyces sp. NPDC051976 TaxID=3154947 RepID=UPI0034234D26
MRFLMSTRPFYGHFHPFVPIAAAALKGGHQVRFATAEEFCPVIERAGFTAVPAGLHPKDPLPPQYAERAYARDYGAFPVTAKAHDLVAAAERWRPDVVLRDPTDVAAVVASEVIGIPCATLGFCRYIPGTSWDRILGPTLDEVRARFGLAPDPTWQRLHHYLYLDVVPPFFQLLPEPVPTLHVFRSGIASALSEDRPEWLDRLPARPTVHVSLGTTFNGRVALLRTLVLGAAELDVNVVGTTGPDVAPEEVIASPPPQVRLERFVPNSHLLPRSDVVVTAGGFNTVLGALERGRPMLVVPLGSDQPRNAQHVVALGVGLSRDPAEATVDQTAEDLRRLLHDPSFRIAATRLEERYRCLPGPEHAVERLVRLGETGLPQLADSPLASL